MDEIAVIGGEGMNDEKAKMLKITTDQIEQKFGRGSIMKLGEGGEHLNIGVIPTGALPLDAALGIGGVPRGRIIEIYGPESSGKTTLALQILAEAQAMGGVVASERLDCLVAFLAGTGREKAAQMVHAGLVSVNHRETDSVSHRVNEGDIISIRRCGRFIVDMLGPVTKKGRLSVKCRKYI